MTENKGDFEYRLILEETGQLNVLKDHNIWINSQQEQIKYLSFLD